MIEDPVAQWRELSALYEQADQLSGDALREWLAELPAEMRWLVPRLQRMLAARDSAVAEQFLEALPPVGVSTDHASLDWEAGRRIGPYRLVRHAGSGGMAEVWLAERDDGAFSRTVAIKLLRNHPTRAQQETFVERFKRERDILASLDHPNIARLHDAGITPEGQPWLALEFVEGEAITSWCDRERLTIEARVRLFRQVLLAIEHAHARLVIHRDVKPSNVLVTASGTVSLLDFGIAKLLESDGDSHVATALTRQGGRPLTPQYASPEQLLGEALTTACDVYSLGVMLYELLVGRLPYVSEGRSLAQLEAAVMGTEPISPSATSVTADALMNRSTTCQGLRRILKPELDAIVLRALEKKPSVRYESVGAMRSDLDRWLAHEPVLAALPGAAQRMRKFIRRHRMGVGVVAVVASALLLATSVVAWQMLRAEEERARALASKDFLLDMFHLSDPNLAKVDDVSAGQLLDASVARAHTLLAKQPELHADVLLRVAQIDQYLSRYVPAQEALREAAAINEAAGHQKQWASAMVELFDVTRRNGDLKSADALVAKVVPTLERLKDDSSLQARQHEARGWLAKAEGDLRGASSHMLAAVASSRVAYPSPDSRTADALRGLATVEASLKDYGPARHHASEAKDVAAAAPNASPTDRIGAEIDEAVIEFTSGEYGRALSLMNGVIGRCDSSLSANNENCLAMREQKALLLIKVGRASDAIPELPAFESQGKNALSPQNQMEARLIMVRILAANGRWHDADAVADELKRLIHENAINGYSAASIPSALFALEELQIRKGQGAAAIKIMDEAQRLSNPNMEVSAFKARALMLSGLALQETGEQAAALKSLQAAERAYGDAYGPLHTQTLLCRLNQLIPLATTGKTDDAMHLIDTTLPMLRSRLPLGAPVIGQIESIRMDVQRRDQPAIPFFN